MIDDKCLPREMLALLYACPVEYEAYSTGAKPISLGIN
jgi:hypothetical protein